MMYIYIHLKKVYSNKCDNMRKRYRVRATIGGYRKTTDKYWYKKRLAQKYADETNYYTYRANARVVIDSNKQKR